MRPTRAGRYICHPVDGDRKFKPPFPLSGAVLGRRARKRTLLDVLPRFGRYYGRCTRTDSCRSESISSGVAGRGATSGSKAGPQPRDGARSPRNLRWRRLPRWSSFPISATRVSLEGRNQAAWCLPCRVRQQEAGRRRPNSMLHHVVSSVETSIGNVAATRWSGPTSINSSARSW